MNKLFATLLKAGLIVGTLDILSAFVYYFIGTHGKPPWDILRYVASGLFGQAAYTGGPMMYMAGLFFHYVIAFSFTLFFFWLFPRVKAFAIHKILTGIGYGIFVWSVMNLIVVPLSNIPGRPLNVTHAIINAVILIVCIGIPLSLMANSFYKKANPSVKKNT
jgi:hypothetical protein